MNRKTLALISLLTATHATAFETSRQAIVAGDVDMADLAVVSVVAHASGDMSTWYQCTGVLVSPRIVLTAAHCLSSTVGNVIEVGVGTTPFPSGESVHPMGVQADPKFNPKNLTSGHDVAVVILQNPLSIPPLPVNRRPLDAALVGQSMRQVGYGANDGQGAGMGTKRQAQTSLSHFNATQEFFGDATHAQCHGDSGGPSLMVIDGVETVVGVSSWGVSDAQGQLLCADGSWDTRTDVAAQFFDRYIRQFDPDYTPAIIVPSPDVVSVPAQGCSHGSGGTSLVLALVSLVTLLNFRGK